MNIDEFTEQFSHLRDVDKIDLDPLCDHPQHISQGKQIGKGPAKRNILKNGGERFICRACQMKHDNPMKYVGKGRQTDEIITVYCPCPDHEGDPARTMKRACFYGKNEEPYLQICGSCAQRGKEIPDDQREKIRIALTGIKRSEEFKQRLSEYMKNNPEALERAKQTLDEYRHLSSGFTGKTHSEETRQKMSEAHSGKTFSEEHRKNISKGRKKMLAETGGFTREHREKISAATARQYAAGFDPQLHHRKGWHESPKAGKVFYRSSYEKKAYDKLDADDSVKTYTAESVVIAYTHPKKEITSKYLIDIAVEFMDGSKKLIEVKPQKWLQDEIVVAKCEAAALYAEQHGIEFELWTELELFGAVYNERNMREFVAKLP